MIVFFEAYNHGQCMHKICYMFEGPTSFSPIIEMATTIVEQSGGQYHVLVIIADGQVGFFSITLLIFIF